MNQNQKGFSTIVAIVIAVAVLGGTVYWAKTRSKEVQLQDPQKLTKEELLKLFEEGRNSPLPPPPPISLVNIPSRYTIHYGIPTDESVVYRDEKNFRIDYFKNQILNQSRYFIEANSTYYICNFKNGVLISHCYSNTTIGSNYPYPDSESNNNPEFVEAISHETLPNEQIIGVTAKCTRLSLVGEYGPYKVEYCVHPQFSNLILRRDARKATVLSFEEISSNTFVIPEL